MMKPRVDRLQVYESPQHLVLLGHRRRTGRWRIAVALLGAVRFLDAYYLLFVTRREPVGILAGHTIFRAEETAMISLRPGGFSTASRVLGVLTQLRLGGRHFSGRWGESWDEGWAERRYRSLFLAMDLTRDFYFSYTYDLSRTLQESAPPLPLRLRMRAPAAFVWSHYLMLPVLPKLRDGSWLVPLVHGFFRQCSLALCGRLITLTLLARRSRLFAGARLLKRGLCAAGHVANEVETEQALHAGRLASFVQLRGSVPLVWGHGEEGRHMIPRPDICVQSIDPSYSYTLRHLEELWGRYGGPLVLFDLVRQAEKRPRETLLGRGLAEAVDALQARLRRERHPQRDGGLRYVPFDFKKESKRKGSDVLAAVERLALHMVLVLEAALEERPASPSHPRKGAGPARAAAGVGAANGGMLVGGGGLGGLLPGGQGGVGGFSFSFTSTMEPSSPRDVQQLEQLARSTSNDSLDSANGSGDASPLARGLAPRAFQTPLPPSGGDAAGRAGATLHELVADADGGARRVPHRQSGVVRTNCIDCLDRTNVAQFCIGRCVLKQQLAALGVSRVEPRFSAGSRGQAAGGQKGSEGGCIRAVGTQLALQYAGSQALHATNSNAAKDFLQSVKRFYRNTFTDVEKQHIIDVFLGVFHALFDDLYAPRGHVSFDRLLSRPFALPFVPKGARLHGSGAGSASGGGDEQHLVSPSGEEAWPDRSSAGDGTAALAAADAALGVPGGRWGAAGYSEGAVELAKVGELPVMLPAGYAYRRYTAPLQAAAVATR
ncbi:hypothetical protein EMIHUDRAFT_450701 [Emiliania huxleyi CCMP1516]|uniref:SAC domain-containing protein n=2 Tax=Emiliania huxleyi TaxID=2903 RepID=A0A0D3JF71_EMIH1|nr:hypothetical protein EMIHUDRAFT_450701 [Emiliania huxleyi CCMP1516]EOD22156.1 hypothetical protein EMIHUDRAFT_450701 [Emiliania huxleyi CCMP1516]|eukprot:XP_005774585.1 hypothetical protein EMIHUDRAFT_450701 [Emiliania huxleyi CCMP1516]